MPGVRGLDGLTAAVVFCEQLARLGGAVAARRKRRPVRAANVLGGRGRIEERGIQVATACHAMDMHFLIPGRRTRRGLERSRRRNGLSLSLGQSLLTLHCGAVYHGLVLGCTHGMHSRIRLHEVFGLSPLPERAREAWLAVRGGAGVLPSLFDLTSLKIFHPALSVGTWLGRVRDDRRIPISNLFNRTPTPIADGWSVRKRQVRDFRGGTLTYDSHNGTDFAVPVGSRVAAAAPGRVLRISSEFNRGGLKVFIDHGDGLVTTSNHLARALVATGDLVQRGQVVALSGYSGLDGLIAFPWSVPHVHFNVWLDGEYVDPFAAAGETPLWHGGNDPLPLDRAGSDASEHYTPTTWNAEGVDATLASCADEATRCALDAERDPDFRAMNVLFQRNYYPTRFAARPALIVGTHARTARLSLPFCRDDFTGIVMADEEGSVRGRY